MSIDVENKSNRQPIDSSKKRVVECPNCSYPIVAGLNDRVVNCPCCSTNVNLEAPSVSNDRIAERVAGIKTVSAAKSYINLLFETYNWDKFSHDASVYTVPEIDILLQNMKVNQGDDKETWKLCFDYLATCVEKKIENVNNNIDIIVEKYLNGANENSCHNNFDILRESIILLKNKQQDLLHDLDHYIVYALRNDATDDEIAAMRKKLNELTDAINDIQVCNEFDQHPKVQAKRAEMMHAMEEELGNKGIDAPTLYANAIEDYEALHFQEALDQFVQIVGYKETNKYIQLISKLTVINDRYYYMHNQLYFCDKFLYPSKANLMDINNPITDDFTSYFTYGDFFYYYDKNNFICVYYYDLNQKETGKKKKKVEFNQISVYGKYDSIIFNEKRPSECYFLIEFDPTFNIKEKQTFFKQKGSKQKITYNKKIVYKDWHDLLLLNMKTHEMEVIIEGIHSVVKCVDDEIYYIAPLPVYKKKNITGYDGTGLFSYNIKTKENKKLITGNSNICDVYADKSIVFTRNDHGKTNKTIFTKKNLEDLEEYVVVKNVYQYYQTIKGRIFYLVGNANIKSLCSINPDGSDYKEVMKYMKDIVFSDEDWLYITRGDNSEGYRTLYRLPVNGGDAQRVAFGIHEDDLSDDNRLIYQGYLYYTNYFNVLCKVRLNGTGLQELVKDVAAIVTISHNKIFYLCIDGKENGTSIISLYNMNSDGSNRQKLIHNLSAINSIDQTHLLFSRYEPHNSKKEMYENLDDPKLVKQIDKMYKKLAKKKKDFTYSRMMISIYDCEDGTSQVLANDLEYPTKKSLKIDMKEALKK